jgi:hypothetical protein
MDNRGELAVNVVAHEEPKVLIGFNPTVWQGTEALHSSVMDQNATGGERGT